MSSHFSTFIVNTEDNFEAVRNSWNLILEKSRSKNLFLRWEWLYNWWSIYRDDNSELKIIIVKMNGEIVGIAPLYLHTRSLSGFRELRFLGSAHIGSDYLDFIIVKEYESLIIPEILKYIKDNTRWDLITLSDVPLNSPVLSYAKTLFNNHSIYLNNSYTTCPFLKLSKGAQDMMNGVASNLRNIIKRKSAKLGKLKDTEFIDCIPKDGFKVPYDHLLELNKIRAEVKGIKSPFLDNRFDRFHRKILSSLFPLGMAKLSFLKINGQPVAANYLFQYNSTVYYYQSGFDPQWKQLSPGTLLHYHCIQSAIEEGIEKYDFLRGDEQYKKLWTRSNNKNAIISIHNNTIKGALNCIYHKLHRAGKDLIRPKLKKCFLPMIHS